MAKPKTTKLKRWTNEEIEFLKENFATMMHKELGEALNRTEQAVRAKCFELNLYKKEYPWTDKELEYLKTNYKNMTYRQIGKELGRTVDAVRSKAAILGIVKDLYHCDYDYFKVIDTEEKAYWLGFIFADGWTCLSKSTEGGCLGIELQESDIGHLRKFNKSINGNYKIDRRTRENFGKEHTTCLIRIYSRDLTDDLILHGVIPNKSLVKQFPTTVPNNLIRHFIRGYFDGNGTVRINSDKTSLRFCIRSGSKEFLNELKAHLTCNSIYVGEIITEKHNDKLDKDTCFSFNVYSNFENSIAFYNYLYKNSSIYLDKKYFKATSAKNSLIRKKSSKIIA